jgi:hypothetical protein
MPQPILQQIDLPLKMCTVTFIPRSKGYCLGMNRDEKRSRVKGLLPAVHESHGHRIIYPSEPTGGTWIALNDQGVSFALINWYSIPARVISHTVSRGEVIPSVAAADSSIMVDRNLAQIPLKQTNPFRLVAVFPNSREIVEWRWDLKQLTRKEHRWRAQQWISSGFNEPQAQKVRSATFKKALNQKKAGSLRWLRRLHRSHVPHSGPFSICMHRDDAVTVSYTEVCLDHRRWVLRHWRGQGCSNSDLRFFELRNAVRAYSNQ